MDTPQRRRAVVLGAAGFVGRHVARALSARGVEVVGLGHGDWSADERAPWGLQDWVRGDIDLPTLSRVCDRVRPDAIVHCAGSGTVSYAYADPLADYQRAVDSTAAMLEWVRTARRDGHARCRAVLVSSAAVYGDQGDVDCAETSIRAPISPYGYHKLGAETLCDSYSRFFDVEVSIVRLFSVYGEGLRKQLLWDALGKFGRGESRFFGTGHELRDWVHVDDAARLLVAAALDEQEPFEIYNGGGVHATTREILQRLADAWDDGAEVVFSGETHVGNPRRLTANCAHGRRQLGWSPQVTLAQGVERYVRWYRDAVGGGATPPPPAPAPGGR